ncbi:uncharacterized protein MELLADRAFT_68196 [Melampsora larici-populina 98AG31]|uniref:Uncharacterized protein n=1 Tax=Melampsora larici-populina (strain 98AG31 / pathotype 3-4-7) TaxID=747676 RepID=F4S5X7_MELLP|nr:uncharacterized protein MELLADRAFT_68196 [Melampsora larici-populina 98AG31]EGF99991.1 hypothetical protein MELLADRAFT_68196 [Melampsora larici-populina 98AG31]
MSQSPPAAQSTAPSEGLQDEGAMEQSNTSIAVSANEFIVIPESQESPINLLSPTVFQPVHAEEHTGANQRDHDTEEVTVAEAISTLVLLFAESEPDRFRRRNLSYAAVRRFIGLKPLRDYMVFAGLAPSETSKALRILSGHAIHSFHVFLFPELISPKQMYQWGISYGVGAELILHAEGYYHKLLRRERRNQSAEL